MRSTTASVLSPSHSRRTGSKDSRTARSNTDLHALAGKAGHRGRRRRDRRLGLVFRLDAGEGVVEGLAGLVGENVIVGGGRNRLRLVLDDRGRNRLGRGFNHGGLVIDGLEDDLIRLVERGCRCRLLVNFFLNDLGQFEHVIGFGDRLFGNRFRRDRLGNRLADRRRLGRCLRGRGLRCRVFGRISSVESSEMILRMEARISSIVGSCCGFDMDIISRRARIGISIGP